MATEKWIAGSGVGLTWTTIMSADLNSLANGNALLQAADIDNSSALDIFADLSLHLASLTPTGLPFVGIFQYPLNDDATTYGDGRFTAAAAMTAANAPSAYWAGNIPLVASAGAQNGTLRGLILPPGKTRFVLWNQAGPAFASSGNTLKYRTYNRQIA